MNQTLKPFAIVHTGELNTYRLIGEGAASTPFESKQNANRLVAVPELINALRAIVARIEGNFDCPALVEYGLLSPDIKMDVLCIAEAALKQIPG